MFYRIAGYRVDGRECEPTAWLGQFDVGMFTLRRGDEVTVGWTTGREEAWRVFGGYGNGSR